MYPVRVFMFSYSSSFLPREACVAILQNVLNILISLYDSDTACLTYIRPIANFRTYLSDYNYWRPDAVETVGSKKRHRVVLMCL